MHGQRKQGQAPRVKREVSARVASPAVWCAHRGPGCPLQPVCLGTESLENKNGQGECLENISAWPWNPGILAAWTGCRKCGGQRGDASEACCPGNPGKP